MFNFADDWTRKVRPIAVECVTDEKLIEILSKFDTWDNVRSIDENVELSEEDKNYLINAISKYEDYYGMYEISKMIKKVDGLAKGEVTLFNIAGVFAILMEVYDEYKDEVIKNKFTNLQSPEAQSRIKLCNAMHRYLGIK